MLGEVVRRCFIENADHIKKMNTMIVNKKIIENDEALQDMINYTVGSIKCFTQSNAQVQKECIKLRYIQTLSKAIDRTL